MPRTNIESLAAAYAIARDAYAAAEAAKKAAAAELAAAMAAAGLKSAATAAGKATVVAGRRTVSVTCPALKAEIKLLEERAVRTGRAEERIGQPSIRLS